MFRKRRIESGYCESFNAGFRDEMLNGEIFYSPPAWQLALFRAMLEQHLAGPTPEEPTSSITSNASTIRGGGSKLDYISPMEFEARAMLA